MTEIKLGGYNFKGVCRIIPELDENGRPIEFMPQSEYNNVNNVQLNEYGRGPFCKFKIPSDIDTSGVYALSVNGAIKYIG